MLIKNICKNRKILKKNKNMIRGIHYFSTELKTKIASSAYQKWPTWHSCSAPDSNQASQASYPLKVILILYVMTCLFSCDFTKLTILSEMHN